MSDFAAEAPAPEIFDPDSIARSVVAGDRRALARAITRIESTRPDHRAGAEVLLARLARGAEAGAANSIRIGITGVPGVGKSTFIEAFGLRVIEAGHRIAVLAVDPSSPRSGGSILGDKTRMEELARAEDAFIRPSPSGGTLGGVARRSRDAMLACEAAGFDVIVVETVGVGQSETAVADMVDLFVLLLAPGGGDELQGIKKGVVEMADLVVVNKDDGALAPIAGRMQADYANALHLLRPTSADWTVPVLRCSALERRGIAEVWRTAERFRGAMTGTGALAARRSGQARAWMWREIGDGLIEEFRADPRVAALLARTEAAVATGELTPAAAARLLLAAFNAGRE